MIRRPPRSTRTDTLFPYTTLFRSDAIGSDDNLYVFTDVSAAIPETPLTLKAHYGYTDGSLGGLNGSYSDWSIGASASWKALNFGVAYVDTSISKGDDVFAGSTRKIAQDGVVRSEEHTSELQSLMRISYAVFCLKK